MRAVGLSSKQKYPANNGLALFKQIRAKKARAGAEPWCRRRIRRLYDGLKHDPENGTPRESALPGLLRTSQNLDAPPLSPYTSAVPWMDVFLNPRAGLKQDGRAGMEEDFLRCRGAAN